MSLITSSSPIIINLIDSSDEDDENGNDEPDKLEFSSLPDNVKMAIEMGELSQETAEILRQEAMVHAQKEYEELKKKGKF